MAQQEKISGMPDAGPLDGSELFEVSQDIGGGTLGSRKAALSVIKAWLDANGVKNNTAAADPTVNDDETQGYSGITQAGGGSVWFNSASGEIFRCADATTGAAQWPKTTLTLDELGSAALVNTGTGAGDVPLNSDLGTAAYEQFNRMPFMNQLLYSGRFTDADYGLTISGAFQNLTSIFVPYNGCSISDAGQFIHNNSDYGGSAGNMVQAVIDLVEDQGRGALEKRYGPEFRIAEFLAGGGTAGGLSATEGTKYPVAVSSSGVLGFGADNYTTVCFWVAAIDNPVYLYISGSNKQHWVNGVEAQESAYVLDPADGYVFYRVRERNTLGYTTSTPRIAATSGDRVRVALPSKFPGLFDPGIYFAPFPNTVPL